MERGSVSVPDGARIVWRTVGDGEGVVIVPGSLSDGSDWLRFAERIASGFAAHVMSRRGTGDSADGPTYALEREYEDTLAVLDATASTCLVGHSFGAVCALGAALLHGDLNRLVVYEPPLTVDQPVVPADALEEIQRAAERGEVESVLDIGLRRCVRVPDEQVERIKTMPIWRDMVRNGVTWPRELRAMHEEAAGVERYKEITVRTLLPVGEFTQRHHRVAAEALLDVLPDARLIEIPRSAHQGHVEAPEGLARELIAFLR